MMPTIVPIFLRLAFDGRRFDADAVRRMLGHFRCLVEGILGNPSGRLADLALEDRAERDGSAGFDPEVDFSTLMGDEIDAFLMDAHEVGPGAETS